MFNEKKIITFDKESDTSNWEIINDVVMGGISKSSFVISSNNTATFSGILSKENNGGFASVRTTFDAKSLNNFSGVIIKAKVDGNIYSLRFRTDSNYDGVAYQAKFKSIDNTWTEHKIPFEEFVPTFRGVTLKNKPKLKSRDIQQIGIMIADKQFGEFKVDIEWIKFYK